MQTTHPFAWLALAVSTLFAVPNASYAGPGCLPGPARAPDRIKSLVFDPTHVPASLDEGVQWLDKLLGDRADVRKFIGQLKDGELRLEDTVPIKTTGTVLQGDFKGERIFPAEEGYDEALGGVLFLNRMQELGTMIPHLVHEITHSQDLAYEGRQVMCGTNEVEDGRKEKGELMQQQGLFCTEKKAYLTGQEVFAWLSTMYPCYRDYLASYPKTHDVNEIGIPITWVPSDAEIIQYNGLDGSKIQDRACRVTQVSGRPCQ